MERKPCPYCGEEIAVNAKKCRYCGEWLEEKVNQTSTHVSAPITNGTQTNIRTQAKTDTKTEESTPPKLKICMKGETQGFFKTYFIDSLLKQYASFSGYSSRKEFWLSYVALMVIEFGIGGICLILAGVGGINGILIASILSSIIGLALFLPTLAISCRRLRDAGCSPWMILISLIPVIGILILLFMFCKPSELSHTNKCHSFNYIDAIIIGVCVILFGVGIWNNINSVNNEDYEELRDLYESNVEEEYSVLDGSRTVTSSDKRIPFSMSFVGYVDDKYGVEMLIMGYRTSEGIFPESGKCRYTKYKGAWIDLSFEVEEADEFKMFEHTDGNITGIWNVYFDRESDSIFGYMTNYKGDTYPVALKAEKEDSRSVRNNSQSAFWEGYNKITGNAIVNSKKYPFYIDFNYEDGAIKNAVYHNPNYSAQTNLTIVDQTNNEYYFEGRINNSSLRIRFSTDPPYEGTIDDGSNVLKIKMNL